MNSYDKAHELAKSLKEDKAVIEYKSIKEKIALDKELNDKIEKFKNERLELQLKSMQSGEVDKDLEEQVKKDYQDLLSNSSAVEYFEKEVKINVLVSDIQKIIYEDIKDILN